MDVIEHNKKKLVEKVENSHHTPQSKRFVILAHNSLSSMSEKIEKVHQASKCVTNIRSLAMTCIITQAIQCFIYSLSYIQSQDSANRLFPERRVIVQKGLISIFVP